MLRYLQGQRKQNYIGLTNNLSTNIKYYKLSIHTTVYADSFDLITDLLKTRNIDYLYILDCYSGGFCFKCKCSLKGEVCSAVNNSITQ